MARKMHRFYSLSVPYLKRWEPEVLWIFFFFQILDYWLVHNGMSQWEINFRVR